MSEFSTLNGYKVKDKKAIRFYDNVSNMKTDTTLKEGMHVKTKGYYSVNDGGGSEYYISSIQSETEYQEELQNGLYATIIIKNSLNVKQIGAYGDGSHDDTSIIRYAISNYKNVYFPNGTYIISSNIDIDESITIHGENNNNTVLKTITNNSIFTNYASYVTIKNLKFKGTDEFNNSLIVLSSKDFHLWNDFIYNCIFEGNNQGNAIYLSPNQNLSYGYMNLVIEKNNFHNFEKAIYVNLLGTSWANCGSIKDCWQYDCVYGLFIDENSNGINYWNIINFSGQNNSSISNTHIKNLKGENNKIDTCILYDGGYGIDISPYAKRTTIINCKTGYYPIRDLGYLTNIINDGEDIDGTYYELNENFIGKNAFTKSGSTQSNSEIASLGGIPVCNISTGDVINNYSILDLNKQLIYGRNLQARQNFGFMLTSIANLKFYLGIELGLDGAFQGTFLKYDSSVDDKLHLIQKGSSSESINETLITLEANKWYDVQLIRDNKTDKIYLWINNNYVISIDNTLNYHAQPYFRIDTLENVNKVIQLRNVKCRTFHYNQ